MTYRDTNDEGQSITYYTDGLIFSDNENDTFPGAEVTKGVGNKANYFTLDEGIWYMPYDYRVCVYTARQIYDTEGFLDVDKRIKGPPKNFLRLETEIELKVDASWSANTIEYYYDLTFLDEEGVFKLLAEDLSLFDKGNLYTQYNKIEIIDRVFI